MFPTELPFISLDVEGVETENLPSADDGTSHSVEIDNGYPLGCEHTPQVYVGFLPSLSAV